MHSQTRPAECPQLEPVAAAGAQGVLVLGLGALDFMGVRGAQRVCGCSPFLPDQLAGPRAGSTICWAALHNSCWSCDVHEFLGQ